MKYEGGHTGPSIMISSKYAQTVEEVVFISWAWEAFFTLLM